MRINTNENNKSKFTFQSHNPHTDFELVEKTWLSLQGKCQHSFFTSWGWISTWLKDLPSSTDVRYILGYIHDEPVLAFFIGRGKRMSHRIIPVTTISLNATADRQYDELTIEYNSMLFNREHKISMNEILEYLKAIDWNEFILSGVSYRFVSSLNVLEHPGNNIHFLVDRTTNTYFVELEKIRETDMDYFKLISSNKRNQIRRSIKQYERDGKITVRESASTDEALQMLDELAALHQQEWTKRGSDGSFSNKFFYQFHKDLIRNRFDLGEIQLLHIFTHARTIGYLYNFVYQGNVLFYQCGFNYMTENVYRPGLVSHYLAIMHNAQKNMKTYDFLAGDSAYKTSLSTNSSPMYWLRYIKNRSLYDLEILATRLKDMLKNREKEEASG